MSKVIVMTGGGTAGHVIPNLALLSYLKEYFDEFHYIGSSNGVEKDIISDYSFIEYHEVPTIKLVRSMSLNNLKIPFVLSSGIKKAKQILRKIKPDIIFSKGGYVALPVVRAAGKIPVICHESDLSIGLANRLSIKRCDIVCTSFEDTASKLRNGMHTGAPIRKSLYEGKKLSLEFNNSLPILLIMGGSLGARAINNCVKESLNQLLLRYNVVHIAGKGNLFADETRQGSVPREGATNLIKESVLSYAGILSGYNMARREDGERSVVGARQNADLREMGGRFYQFEYVSNIEDYYKTADIVVSRGGAGSMFELMALGKKALIIPLPKGNSRGDQIENAEYFKARGCCHVLSQEQLTTETLLEGVRGVEQDRGIRASIQKTSKIDGTKRIAELIISTAKSKKTL